MFDVEKQKAKVRAEVAKRGLTSFMNETKWRELQRAACEELPFSPPYQRKDVLLSEPEPTTFDADVWYLGDWREGIHPFYSIEWLRIRPRYLKHNYQLLAPGLVDCAESLRAVLARDHIPYVEREQSIWIFGYARELPS